MAKPTLEEIPEIAEDLRGTCKTLDDVLEAMGYNIDDMSTDMLASLDDEVMLCDTCGWWIEACEMEDGYECNDCKEDGQ